MFDKVNELMENHILELFTEGEIAEEKDKNDCTKNLILHSQEFKTIEVILQYINQQ